VELPREREQATRQFSSGILIVGGDAVVGF
jgi:hypothetical protein